MPDNDREIIMVPQNEEPVDRLVAELIRCLADLYIELEQPTGWMVNAAPIFDFSGQIGERIRMERDRRHMTQQGLAMRMHMDKSTISRNERGLNLTLDAVPLYAEQLGCSVHDLVPDFDFIGPEDRNFDRVVEQFRLGNGLSNDEMEGLLMRTALYLHEHKAMTQDQAKRL